MAGRAWFCVDLAAGCGRVGFDADGRPDAPGADARHDATVHAVTCGGPLSQTFESVPA